MIVESLVDLFFNILTTAFSGMQIIGLPMDVIYVLQTILGYGIYIVGADLMAIMFTMIVSWWMIKFTVGFVIWVWELLPLT